MLIPLSVPDIYNDSETFISLCKAFAISYETETTVAKFILKIQW